MPLCPKYPRPSRWLHYRACLSRFQADLRTRISPYPLKSSLTGRPRSLRPPIVPLLLASRCPMPSRLPAAPNSKLPPHPLRHYSLRVPHNRECSQHMPSNLDRLYPLICRLKSLGNPSQLQTCPLDMLRGQCHLPMRLLKFRVKRDLVVPSQADSNI